MFKILLIGDIHFKVDNALESDDFVEKTLEYVQKEKENLNLIVLLGDILDTHEKINLHPLYRATNFIIELSKLVKTFVLIGNHDRLNNAVFLTDEHAFIALKNHNSNLTIVDKVVVYEDMVFVPYVPNGKFMKALQTVDYDSSKHKIIFAHQEFVGCKMDDFESRDGDYWPKDNPPIYSGHIHQYQVIENITYVGTPFQHCFTDEDEKMLMILSIADNKITEERFSLPLVRKRQITINVKDVAEYQIDTSFITRLVIEGEDKAIRKIIMNKDISQKLKHPNLRYKIKYIENIKKLNELKKEDADIKKLNFSERLEKKIYDLKDKNIIDIYEQITHSSSSSS